MNEQDKLKFLGEERNFLGLPLEFAHPGTAGVIIVPVPFEETTTYGKGAAKGPEAILAASHHVELFDSALDFDPYKAAGGIATLSPLHLEFLGAEEVAALLRRVVTRCLQDGKFPVTLGGEHTSIVGAAAACCAAYDDVTILHLDAHSDLRETYEGSRWNHACAAARMLEHTPKLVQAGVRSQAREERERAGELGLRVFRAHDIHWSQEMQSDWPERIIGHLSERVYISLDVDVLDPAVIPGTGTPEPDGLTWREMDVLLDRVCAAREVVGLDVSELAPVAGAHQSEYAAAKLIYRFLGYRFGR